MMNPNTAVRIRVSRIVRESALIRANSSITEAFEFELNGVNLIWYNDAVNAIRRMGRGRSNWRRKRAHPDNALECKNPKPSI